jgi:hypothetical protein
MYSSAHHNDSLDGTRAWPLLALPSAAIANTVSSTDRGRVQAKGLTGPQ